MSLTTCQPIGSTYETHIHAEVILFWVEAKSLVAVLVHIPLANVGLRSVIERGGSGRYVCAGVQGICVGLVFIMLQQVTKAILKLAPIATWRRGWRLFYHGRNRHDRRKGVARIESKVS